MDDPADQRRWQSEAPKLQLLVDQTWNEWVRGGKQQVEQAQNVVGWISSLVPVTPKK